MNNDIQVQIEKKLDSRLNRRLRLLTLSDTPLSTSGVAHVARNMCIEMLKTGNFEVVSLGGAIFHQNYNIIRTEELKELWTMAGF